jgi:hypothetical protein
MSAPDVVDPEAGQRSQTAEGFATLPRGSLACRGAEAALGSGLVGAVPVCVTRGATVRGLWVQGRWVLWLGDFGTVSSFQDTWVKFWAPGRVGANLEVKHRTCIQAFLLVARFQHQPLSGAQHQHYRTAPYRTVPYRTVPCRTCWRNAQ